MIHRPDLEKRALHAVYALGFPCEPSIARVHQRALDSESEQCDPFTEGDTESAARKAARKLEQRLKCREGHWDVGPVVPSKASPGRYVTAVFRLRPRQA